MTNAERPMTNPRPIQKFDLEERTAVYGAAVITFAKHIPGTIVNLPLISQLVRSSTSVGANYVEADDAHSKKDFLFKIGICKREARETKHWLRMIATVEPGLKTEARGLWQEAKELYLIFAAIMRTGRTAS